MYVIRESLQQLHPKNGITIVFSAQTATWDKKALPMKLRQEMFTLAIQSLPEEIRSQVHFSSIEEQLQSGGYTINTLKALVKTNIETNGIVMGADAAIGIPDIHAGFIAWKEWREILKLCTLIVVPRGRYPTAKEVKRHLPPELANAQVLETTPNEKELHSSSTAIQQGHDEFLTPAVRAYTQNHNLIQ